MDFVAADIFVCRGADGRRAEGYNPYAFRAIRFDEFKCSPLWYVEHDDVRLRPLWRRVDPVDPRKALRQESRVVVVFCESFAGWLGPVVLW